MEEYKCTQGENHSAPSVSVWMIQARVMDLASRALGKFKVSNPKDRATKNITRRQKELLKLENSIKFTRQEIVELVGRSW